MTLKSNKNEAAVILEPVNSVRTALSDLYLEQLLQHKPKSDKVICPVYLSFLLAPYSLMHMFASGITKILLDLRSAFSLFNKDPCV